MLHLGHDLVGRARHVAGDPARARRPTRSWPGSTLSWPRCERRAHEHRLTPMIGRRHGIHAEPITFGLKLAGYFAEFEPRPRARWPAARRDRDLRRSPGRSAPSPTSTRGRGAVAASGSGLRPEPVSTQMIPRDRHAAFFAALALVARRDRAAGDRGAPLAAHRGAARSRSRSPRGRRAARPCPTSGTRSCPRT